VNNPIAWKWAGGILIVKLDISLWCGFRVSDPGAEFVSVLGTKFVGGVEWDTFMFLLFRFSLSLGSCSRGFSGSFLHLLWWYIAIFHFNWLILTQNSILAHNYELTSSRSCALESFDYLFYSPLRQLRKNCPMPTRNLCWNLKSDIVCSTRPLSLQ
jgi:hypothetical protein